MTPQKRVLFSILNWGLGHATRCMPIIDLLISKDIEVILASDGRAYHLLKESYPNLKVLELPSYDIQYQSNNMFWNIATQMPQLIKAIWKEHRYIQKLVKDYQITGLISDNRFGCFVKTIPSVFISHQINLDIPSPLLSYFANVVNHYFIKRFDTCWIPDIKSNNSLAGKLSHPALDNGVYIGLLSRMRQAPVAKQYDIAVVLSGPEPQRTYLEKILLEQLLQGDKQAIIIQGKTESQAGHQVYEDKITLMPYLTTKALKEVLLGSQLIVSRSGYSSLMDLVALNRSALLIPTPGQTEQLYLAQQLHQQGAFMCQYQDNIDLQKAWKEQQNYKGLADLAIHQDDLETAVHQFIDMI